MSAPLTRGAAAAADVAALLRARNTLLWIVTREEARAEQAIVEAGRKAGYEPKFWDCATGISKIDGVALDSNVKDPQAVLDKIRDSRKREVWVLRDLGPWLRDPTVCRAVRSLSRTLPASPRNEARAMIILSPTGEVPPELSGHATVIDWPLPDRAEVAEILRGTVEAMPEGLERPDVATFDAAVDAAVGLTAEESSSCYAKSIVTVKKIDPAVVSAEKRRVIARERVLEWYDSDPRGLDAVGGLDELKAWLRRRRPALSQRARDFGLPAPKGVLLVGPPGCGKSLSAKAIAAAWGGIPLLRLDLGALKSKFVGESEGNLRRALQVAEAVAPCILWLDEIEKALAGATQGAADGGVSADALGTVLSWMQEHKAPVFIVATSNDVRQLPAELLRKGRFDEIFWVDLPTRDERVEVLKAALAAHGRKPEDVAGLAAVADDCLDFTGAECAALVPEALFDAFADGERAITTEDLKRAAGTVTPLAKTAGDRLEQLREWAKGRARLASAKAQEAKKGPGRVLDVSEAIEERFGEGAIKAGGN